MKAIYLHLDRPDEGGGSRECIIQIFAPKRRVTKSGQRQQWAARDDSFNEVQRLFDLAIAYKYATPKEQD